MTQFGIFVDAGYLYAAAGRLCCGTIERNRLVLDFKSVVPALRERAAEHCEVPHLRTYWYDGAKDAQPTSQHLDVAFLSGVKLRLGRLVGPAQKQRQKGVDSRIVRDLIILSQERAISVAYLVGGNEDLREGVSEAQERGVRVVLLAVEPLNEQNLSPTLAMEADDIIMLDKSFLDPHISLREEPSATSDRLMGDESGDAIELGRRFGAGWMTAHTPDELSELRRGAPRIPAELDRRMLDEAAVLSRQRHVEEDDRKNMRQGFWQALFADLESS